MFHLTLTDTKAWAADPESYKPLVYEGDDLATALGQVGDMMGAGAIGAGLELTITEELERPYMFNDGGRDDNGVPNPDVEKMETVNLIVLKAHDAAQLLTAIGAGASVGKTKGTTKALEAAMAEIDRLKNQAVDLADKVDRLENEKTLLNGLNTKAGDDLAKANQTIADLQAAAAKSQTTVTDNAKP